MDDITQQDVLDFLAKPLFVATPLTLIITGLVTLVVARVVSGMWSR